MAFLFDPRFQATDANGLPYVGAKLHFYRAGTSTPITIYQDQGATTPHANPVTADISGVFPAIFLAETNNYKIILKDALGITLSTIDNIPPGTVDLDTLNEVVARVEAYAAMLSADKIKFATVADLLADTVMSYTAGEGLIEVGPPDVIEAQGFRYEVAASGASDEHVETAGGVKLYVLPGQTGTNVLAFGLVADGVTDIGPQLQKAFDSDISWLHFPAGTYKLNAVATCSRSIRLTGEPETVIDCSGGAYAILVQGSWSQISDLASDVARYVDRFPLTSATGIEPGDILVINDPTPRAWFGAAEGRDYRKGEMCHDFRVDGADVVIFGQTADSYEASKCDVYKLAPMEVEISDLYLIAGTGYALRVEMFTKYRERNVGGVTTSDRVVNIYLGYDTIVEAPRTQNYAYPKGGTNYTHVVSNLHKYKVLAASMGSSRHALAIGGGQYLPNRYGLIVGCSLECAENGSATGAADMHGCIEFTKYVDCEIRNVGNIAGANTTYQNCDIYSPVPTIAAYGSTIYGSEIAGGTLLIDGCTLHTEGDGNSFAYLNLAPLYEMRDDLHIVIRDISIVSNGGGGTSAQVVGVYRDGTVNTKKINVTVDGVSGYLPNGFMTVLRARNTDGSAFQSDFLIVDNVQLQGPAGNKYLIYPEASIASVPTREMEQRGKITHTSTAAVVNAAADTSFKYRYSRVPAAVVGIGTGSGAVATDGLVAGKIPTPIVYSIDNDSIRPGIVSVDGAAFTAGASVAMTWSAGVFEV